MDKYVIKWIINSIIILQLLGFSMKKGVKLSFFVNYSDFTCYFGKKVVQFLYNIT